MLDVVVIGALGVDQPFRVQPSGKSSEGRNLEAREKVRVAMPALPPQLVFNIFVMRFWTWVHAGPDLCTRAHGSPDFVSTPVRTNA